MKGDRASRTLTVFAAGFLLLDGVLLVLAGAWSRRLGLIVWGVVFVFTAIAVGAYWRMHVRHLSELKDALHAETAELYRLKRDIDKQGS